jgi:serine/threonine protein kinase
MLIGKYRILNTLGEGGMGTARLAEGPDGKLVVLKTTIRDSKDLEDRLIDEARIGMRIDHPNIVKTVELIWHDMRPVLVIDYINGVSFSEILRDQPIPTSILARFGRQITSALSTLHNAQDENGDPLNIVHRDVTPSNIMIDENGCARLIDLGIARFARSMADKTKTGCVRGTLRYLAPELFRGGQCGPRSDLWSLGIVLLSGALGHNPLQGTDPEIIGKIMADKVIDFDDYPELPTNLRHVLEKLLIVNPDDRVKDAAAAADLFAELEKSCHSTQVSSQIWIAQYFAQDVDDCSDIEIDMASTGEEQSRLNNSEFARGRSGESSADFQDITPPPPTDQKARFRSLPTVPAPAPSVNRDIAAAQKADSVHKESTTGSRWTDASSANDDAPTPASVFQLYMNSLRNLEKSNVSSSS